MKTFDFEWIKQIGQQVQYNDRVLVCEDPKPEAAEQIALHTHTFYEILYVFNGTGVGLFSDETYQMKFGSIAIIRPGETHSYFSTNNLSIANICIYPTSLQKRLLDNIIFSELSLTRIDSVEFEQLFFLLKHSLHHSNPAKADTYLNLILNMLSEISTPQHKNDAQWNRLLHYISAHYDTITLDKAAEICNYSASYFCRMFKKDFHMTFVQYIDNIRLEKAKELLLSTDVHIDEISSMVGFSHYTRFYRLFQKEIGVTPRQYRLQQGYKKPINE